MRKKARSKTRGPKPVACLGCGCTEARACVDDSLPRQHAVGCSWVTDRLCSNCYGSLTFAGLAHWNARRNDEAFPECEGWSATDWATALSGEVGELCNFIKKLRRGEPINTIDLAKELADIVTYADHLARFFGINLGEAVRAKFNEVSKRRGSPITL